MPPPRNGRFDGVTFNDDKGDVFGTYDGEYCLGRRHGRGTFSFASGSRFEGGGYQDGKRHGPGTFVFATPADDKGCVGTCCSQCYVRVIDVGVILSDRCGRSK
jgi:hypothetical protein